VSSILYWDEGTLDLDITYQRKLLKNKMRQYGYKNNFDSEKLILESKIIKLKLDTCLPQNTYKRANISSSSSKSAVYVKIKWSL
jgi:hypothetical protein